MKRSLTPWTAVPAALIGIALSACGPPRQSPSRVSAVPSAPTIAPSLPASALAAAGAPPPADVPPADDLTASAQAPDPPKAPEATHQQKVEAWNALTARF